MNQIERDMIDDMKIAYQNMQEAITKYEIISIRYHEYIKSTRIWSD